MIIATVAVDGIHTLKELVRRPNRNDVYALCACGYKGPSREVRPEAGIDFTEDALRDHANHARLENEKIGQTGSIERWTITLQTAWNRSPGVVASIDPVAAWGVNAAAREAIEKQEALRTKIRFFGGNPAHMTADDVEAIAAFDVEAIAAFDPASPDSDIILGLSQSTGNVKTLKLLKSRPSRIADGIRCLAQGHNHCAKVGCSCTCHGQP